LAVKTLFELAGRATSWVIEITNLNAQEIYQKVRFREELSDHRVRVLVC